MKSWILDEGLGRVFMGASTGDGVSDKKRHGDEGSQMLITPIYLYHETEQ